jgi:hypothetical protein
MDKATSATTAHVAPKPPTSHALRRADSSWCVETIWQNGRREQCGHYKLASEAEAFIKDQLQAWHDGQRPLPKR